VLIELCFPGIHTKGVDRTEREITRDNGYTWTVELDECYRFRWDYLLRSGLKLVLVVNVLRICSSCIPGLHGFGTVHAGDLWFVLSSCYCVVIFC